MKKRSLLILVTLFAVNVLFATTQLTYKFANPRIIRSAGSDYFQFDVQIKADDAATYFYGTSIVINFDDVTFLPQNASWPTITTTSLAPEFLSKGYTFDRTITAATKSIAYSIYGFDDYFFEVPFDPAHWVNLTTNFQTIMTISGKLADKTRTAGISFKTSSMNTQGEYIDAPETVNPYASPSLYESADFSQTNVGRVYSALGWSQVDNSSNAQWVDWSTSVNTSIWEGNVSMATADNTAALANNFSIHNDATLIIPANKWLTVAGTLSNPSVGSLTIESGGSLIHATNDVPATIKRDLTGNKYHQVSIPLTAAANPVSNLYLGSYLFSFTESGSDHGTWTSLGVSTTTPLDVDKGYMMKYPDPATLAVSYVGNMRNGTVSPPLSFTDALHGYNLVPNPYPSAIDWTLLSNTNLDNAIWIWNQDVNGGNYGTYGGTIQDGTFATNQFIPVGQAFFVRANAASPSLTIENADRVHSTQAFAKNSAIVENNLHLTATGNSSADEVIVAFNDNWSVGADNADVAKMFGSDGAPQLSCVATDNNNLTINALPFGNGNVVVPLNFSLTATTDVTFEAKGIESFSTDMPIYLDDLMLSKVIDLRVQPSYTFNHSVGNAGNRFQLRFMGVTGTPEQLEAKGNVFMSNGKLFVDVPSMNQSEVTVGVYDALGRQLISNKMMVNGVTEITAPVATGVYIVRVIGGNKTFAGKVFVN